MNESDDKLVITHYSASKVVTWVSAIVIPLVAGFAWIANTAISVNERISRNSYQIEELTKNQSRLIDISDKLHEQTIESKTLIQTVKENQVQLLDEVHAILASVKAAAEEVNKSEPNKGRIHRNSCHKEGEDSSTPRIC